MNEPIIIRCSTDEDGGAILALAALDSRPPPAGETLLAFVGTELRAALPLDGGEAVADPFHRTAELVELLQVRATRVAPRRGVRRYGLAALRPKAVTEISGAFGG